MAETSDLIDVLLRTREVVLRPGNDFSWSGWHGPGDASAEIDALIVQLRLGQIPPSGDMDVLFVVTGPLQELSLSSGWADTFLDLAADFDAAAERARASA